MTQLKHLLLLLLLISSVLSNYIKPLLLKSIKRLPNIQSYNYNYNYTYTYIYKYDYTYTYTYIYNIIIEKIID